MIYLLPPFETPSNTVYYNIVPQVAIYDAGRPP